METSLAMHSASQTMIGNLPSTGATMPAKNSLFKIFAIEALATIRYVLPQALTWMWRKSLSHEIQTIPLEATIDKVSRVGYLNIHGCLPNIPKEKEITPVLLIHGDFGHPYTMLHLADLARKKTIPTFSLYLPSVDKKEDHEIYSLLLVKAIDKIQEIIKTKNGKFQGVLGVGHSKGAILLAEREFVYKESRIKATCSIAGRLNANSEKDCKHPRLREIVQKIYRAIVENPSLPLVQIVPKEDWNAPQEFMAVRPNDHAFSVPGMHLSGLFSLGTRKIVANFLDEFSA